MKEKKEKKEKKIINEKKKVNITIKISLIIVITLILLTITITRIFALEEYEVDMSVNASQVMTKWKPISLYSGGSMSFPGQWSYDTSKGRIVNAENTNNITGFYNPTANYSTMDFSLNAIVPQDLSAGDDDYFGLLIRLSENVDTHNVQSYVFLLPGAQYSPTGWRTTSNKAYMAMNPRTSETNPNNGMGIIDDGSGHYLTAINGSSAGLYKVYNDQLSYQNITLLQQTTSKYLYWQKDTVYNMRVVANGRNIKIYVNNVLQINYTDNSSTYIDKGSYGFFAWSQPGDSFYGINGTATLAHYTINFDPNRGVLHGNSSIMVVSQKKYPTIPTATRAGYTFTGWYTQPTGGTKIDIRTGADVEIAQDMTLYAHWTPNPDTRYVVRHYKQNLDQATYTLAETENKTGTTDTSVTPPVKTYDGFISPSTQTVNINGDGSTVVNYYYTRRSDLSYTVNYLEKGTELALADPKTVDRQLFEKPINHTSEIISIDGYNFAEADPEILTISTGTNIMNIYYTKRNDLQYTVNYLNEDTNEILHPKKDVPGQTFESVIYANTEDIEIEGYDLIRRDPPLLQITTNASSNVINLYYKIRKDLSYTVNYLELETNNVLEQSKTVGEQTYKATIDPTQEIIDIDGYRYNSCSPTQLTISTGTNEINIYYTKKSDLKYYVHYIDEETNETIKEEREVGNQTYNDEVQTSGNIVEIDGYEFVSITPETLNISLTESNNIVNIKYRKKKDLTYTVVYLDKNSNATLHEPKTYLSQTFNTRINSSNERIVIDGYNYDSISPTTLTIGTDNRENIIRIYYVKRTDLTYTINYYLEGTTTKLADSIEMPDQTYGTRVRADDYVIPINGYNYTSSSKESIDVGTNNEENVINIYYTRQQGIQYTVNYLEDGTNTRLRTSKTAGASFQDTREAIEEAIEIEGYRYKRGVPPSITISANSAENVLNVYYEKRDDLEYNVFFVEKDSPHNYIKSGKTVRNQTFRSIIHADSIAEEIEGYTYTSGDPTDLTITANNEENNIDLYYVRRTDLTYTINYIEAGTNNKIIPSKEVNTATFGKEVFAKFEVIDINGFTYQNADKESLIVGVSNSNNYINLYYTRNNNLEYTVNYIDNDTGNRIIPSKTTTKVSFDAQINGINEQVPIDGYNFNRANPSILRVSTNNEQNQINLYYTKKSDIVYFVNYFVDGTRIKIKDSKQVGSQRFGTIIYSRDEFEEIPGYRFIRFGQESIQLGTKTNRNQIDLYYSKLSNVIVKYVDYNTGEEIAEEVTHTELVGERYDISLDKKIIENYELIQEPTNKTGEYETTDKVLTYYYAKKTNVEVRYIDKNTGNAISDPTTIEGYVGKQYSVGNKDIEGYTYIEKSGREYGNMTQSPIVVIYYYAKNTKIEVQYLDKYTGENISDSITLEGYVGKPYETVQKQISNYTYIEVDGIPQGSMTDSIETIKYYYAKNTILKVRFIDKNTSEEIAESITRNGHEGEPYNIETREIDGYTYLDNNTSTHGTMSREGTYLIFYYAKNTSVKVKYLDIVTNEEIEEPITIYGYVGKDYNILPKTIPNYSYENSSGNEAGTMTLSEKEIIFYYSKSTGLIVKYVDINTNEEIAEEKQYENYSTHLYDVTDDKKELEGYTFIKDSGNTTGEYINDPTEVKFYYAKNSTITYKYIDINTGEEIRQPRDIDGYEGKEYNFSADNVEGYTFIENQENIPESFPRDNIDIVFYYAKNSKLIIKYIDFNKQEEIKTSRLVNGYEGKEYNINNYIENISGYNLLSLPEPAEGLFERNDKEISIYYTKLIKVIIKYIDIYTGEEILEGEELELQSGQNYNIKDKAKHIDNYRLVQKPNETGTVMQEDFEAVYYYSKKSSVTIKVVDIDTGEVIKTINITGYSGDNYGIDIPVIDGYECQDDITRVSGIITNDAKTITLHYKGKKQNNNPPEEENIDISDDEEYPEEEVELENEDATTAKTILPQTGEASAIIVTIVVCITSFGIFAFIKQRED